MPALMPSAAPIHEARLHIVEAYIVALDFGETLPPGALEVLPKRK